MARLDHENKMDFLLRYKDLSRVYQESGRGGIYLEFSLYLPSRAHPEQAPSSTANVFIFTMDGVKSLYNFSIDIATDPKHTLWLSYILLIADALLCVLIIEKVPCTQPAPHALNK